MENEIKNPINILIVSLRLLATSSGLDAEGQALLAQLVALKPETAEKINEQFRALAA